MFLALVSLWDRPPPPPTSTLIREAEEGANERERDPFCTLPFVTSEIRARGSAVGPTVKHLFRLLIHSGSSSLSHGSLTQSSFCPSLHSHSLGESRLWQNWTKSSIDSPNERAEKGAVAAGWPKQADYKMRAHVQGRGRLTDNQTLSELRRKW